MKPVKPPRTLRLRDLRQVRLLAHPLRLRLLEQFAAGARTTKQAAAALGEPLTKLYHHVHALERAGLLVVRGRRRIRGAVEASYELAARLFEVDDSLFRGAAGPAVAAAVAEAGQQAMAGFVRRRGGGRPFAARLLVPGDARSVRRLYRDLLSVAERAGAGGDADRLGPAPWVLTMTLVPVSPRRPPRPGRRRARRA
jgi:DNA-binding transcriptional ArsR family regulator